MEVTVNWKGIELDLEGEFEKGYPATRFEPAEGDSFTVMEVSAGGVDITEMADEAGILWDLGDLAIEAMS